MNDSLMAWMYVSRPIHEIGYNDIQKILTTAFKRNTNHQVSGVMIYDHQHFLQYIEGKASVIEPLVKKIRSDERHKEIKTYFEGEIPVRKFVRWNLSYIGSDIYIKLFPELSLHGFNPYEIEKEKVFEVMKKVSEVA